MTDPKAGRELDAEIAERFMGWRWWRSSITGRRCLFPSEPPEWFTELATGNEPLVGDWDHISLPPYSTSIADAWHVVERLNALGWLVGLEQIDTAQGRQWRTSLDRISPYGIEDEFATTAPLALCRAALRAVEMPNPRSRTAGRQ